MENDYTKDELDRMVEDILKPAATDSATTRLFTCRRCGNDFWSTKKKPSMCPDCFRESHLENLKKDGQSAKAKPEAEKPPAPPEPEPEAEAAPKEEAVPEPVPMPEPETDPPFLTVRNLLDLLARVPDPERVPVLLGERTFAGSVELRSLWRVGGETEAVVIIRE